MPLASGSWPGALVGSGDIGTSAVCNNSRCQEQSEGVLGGFLLKPQTLDDTTVGHKHLLPMGDKSQPARHSGWSEP